MSLLLVLLRQERGSLLGWGIGLFLFMLLIGASYSAVKDSSELDDLWNEYPEALREAFGGGESITSVKGYLVSQATSYMPLILGIYAIAAATKRTAGAEERGQLDHILSRPITRLQYLATLSLTLLTTILTITAACILGAIIGFVISGVEGDDLWRIALTFIDVLPISLTFAAFGILLGTSFHRRGPAMGLGLVLVIGSFAVQIIVQVVDELDWLGDATPFGLWGRSDLYEGDGDLLYYGVSLALIALALAAASWRWRTKDLYA